MASFIFQKTYETIRNAFGGDQATQTSFEDIDNSISTFKTPDGRSVSYTEAGLPDGKPIFFLHGIPGSCLEASHLDDISKRHGARMIGLDRPGIGCSTPKSDRTIVDAAKDVNSLADHLDIQTYGVLGVSGGGPYALACAANLPADRLKAVSIVCGLGLRDTSLAGMAWPNWLGWMYGWRFIPRVSAAYVAREGFLGYPEDQRLEMAKKQFENAKDPRDREAFVGDGNIVPGFLRSIRQSFRQGLQGPAHDGWVLCQPATFRVQDIREDLPMQLWYGKDDKNVGLPGQIIYERLGKRANVDFHLTDDTHASIFTRNKDAFVRDLVRSMSD
ncbi:Hypothetical protein D9617_3g018620 [Elsinoe fawcettii]|nr:Hypothetical protein D9617_3g018620 [Elsinoe fawcettii]